MAAQSSVPVRAPRWGVEETHALLDAWTPLHQRRRRAQGDPWVPPHQRRRGSLRGLVDEDWRAVNDGDRRISAGIRANRTGAQCKGRMNYLKSRYRRELSKKKPSQWTFFGALDAVFARDGRLGPTRRRAVPPEQPELAKKQEKGEPSGTSAGLEEDDGEAAGGSTRADRRRDARRSSVAAVLMRVSDMCERVVIKWLEVDAAEAARGAA